MLKSLRKHNKWFMVGFGILLMVAWLVVPAFNQAAKARLNKVVAKFDGRGITALQSMNAAKELTALDAISPGLTQNFLGIKDRDSTHWLLLTRAAEDAGYMGGNRDGREFLDQFSRQTMNQRLRNDFQFYFSLIQGAADDAAREKVLRDAIENAPQIMLNEYARQGLSPDETEMLFARLSAVVRMVSAYREAPRVSDRRAVTLAKEFRDGAVVDYVFVPASLTADQIADPGDAALQAHFDTFKTTKPGEGEYGIGYLLPQRVKIDWMKLDRKAMEDAATLDPVEVRKRFTSNRGRYPGEYAAEKINVERDMKSEVVDRALQSAQLVIQSEVLKATRRLEPDGKYKVLPEGWEQTRPRFETIAPLVVEQVKRDGLTIPLPEVVIKGGSWLTEQDLAALPGIGQSTWRQGSVTIPFVKVVSATRELGGQGVAFPVQVGVPVAEHPLIDAAGDRYYITVLGTRGESAPDSMAEIREKVLKDYQVLKAFEQLKAKAGELRQVAIGGGLEAVSAAVAATATQATPPTEAPVVRRAVMITRQNSGGDANLDDEALRKTVADASEAIDPLTPYGQVEAEKANIVVPTTKHLGVAVFHILSATPLTREEYRLADSQVVAFSHQKELPAGAGSEEDPFSLLNMLKRHDYTSGDLRIRTLEQLRRGEKSEG